MDKEKLDRYIRGEASSNDKEEFVHWLEKDPKHKKEFLALRKLHDINLWHESKKGCTTSNNPRKGAARKIAMEFLKIAAIVVVTFLSIKYGVDNGDSETQTYYAPEGQRAELHLSDGTRVWLNANSRLVYPVHFKSGKRIVTLEGEAFFSVAKNREHPFVVQAKGHHVEVLGTEFNIIAYQESDFFETSLLKGEVSVTTPLKETILLKPQMRLYTTAGKTYRGTITNQDHFLWKEGIISFNHETVEEIFHKLELYYDVKIEVTGNEQLLKSRFTGKFRVLDGIEHVLKVLQLKHQFTYQKMTDKNLIIIK